MELTQEQQDKYDGKYGATMARVMQTLVRYGELFGAKRMVPVTGKYGHLVTSFGLGVISPVYEIMDELIESGTLSKQKFSIDPKPLDPNIPVNPLQDLVFRKFMYNSQDAYEDQLRKVGWMNDDAATCTCYFDEVGNKPEKGDILSWAESSAVVYANSVLGARCNRNSGIIELFGSIAGCVPEFGFLTDEGRKASWRVEVRTSRKPNAQLLGSAVGMKVMEDVPYIFGLDRFLGTELNEDACSYLKDFGAATASNGAVGLYHVDHMTPEAVEQGEALIRPDAKTYVIDDAELQRIEDSYPVMWKNKNAVPKLCFIGCPHLTLAQLKQWTQDIHENLLKNGRTRVTIRTVFTTPPAVLKEFQKTEEFAMTKEMGIVVSYICPLMYMNNPLCSSMPVITNSNKLRTYSTARFYQDEAILQIITGGDASAIPMPEKARKAGEEAAKAAGKFMEAGKKAAAGAGEVAGKAVEAGKKAAAGAGEVAEKAVEAGKKAADIVKEKAEEAGRKDGGDDA